MIDPTDKITKIEMWKGYRIVHLETILGFKFYEVQKEESHLNTFQLKKDAKKFIEMKNRK